MLDADATFGYVSPAAESQWGVEIATLIGSSIFDRAHPDDVTSLQSLLHDSLSRPRATLTGSVRLRQGQQHWRDFELIITNMLHDPAVGGIVTTCHDVTERKSFERKLTQLAFRDPLTGLANRALFHDRVAHSLEQAKRAGHSIAVFFLDLDNFKLINDGLGHGCGDRVLCAVAERLMSCIRAEDTAARLGGDEFTVLIDNASGGDQVEAIAQRVLAALRAPISLEGRDIFTGGSLGIAISSPGQDGVDDMLRKADVAMYHAKNAGKGGFEVFDAHMNTPVVERLELETGLRHALERDEFRVYYQPIVSMADRRILGIEALVRWNHPRREILPPAEFIAVAEETGMIIDISRYVLREASRHVRAWQVTHPGDDPLLLSVNLSARQFQDAGLLGDVRAALHASGLDPSQLQLEITESVLMTDAQATIAKLEALRQLGIRLAIDHFGTGCSSLMYLKQFPLDALKIDRSFVQGAGIDPHDTAIVRSIVALASAFALEVTAEGIESEEQVRHLRRLGCRQGQGYLFARPMSPEQIDELLSRRPAPKSVRASRRARPHLLAARSGV